MKRLMQSLPNTNEFKKLVFDSQYVNNLLSQNVLTYAALAKLDKHISSNSKAFRNASSFIDYLLDLYNDIFTTEYKIDPQIQANIVLNLKLYDFLQNRVNAKNEDFNDLAKKALECYECKKYAASLLLSIGVEFDANEIRNTFIELSSKNSTFIR